MVEKLNAYVIYYLEACAMLGIIFIQIILRLYNITYDLAQISERNIERHIYVYSKVCKIQETYSAQSLNSMEN